MMRRSKLAGHPTFISLFAGAGGLDIGLEAAGLRMVTALDNDAESVNTLTLNQRARIEIPEQPGRYYLQDTKIIESGIEDVSPADLRPSACRAGWVPDVVAGGPPCQPFSSAGKQMSLDDPRGRLFEDFVRIVSDLRPRLILFENVVGLVTASGPSGTPGEALRLVIRAFEHIGYATTCKVLNAADYGVPQRRVRLFILGARQGPLPVFPGPTHSEAPVHTLFANDVKPWVTLGEFLLSQPTPSPQDIVRPSLALAAALQHLPEGSGLKSPGAREATRRPSDPAGNLAMWCGFGPHGSSLVPRMT
jgi:DNA (cytosine-5)-methyltransferase 1